MEYRIGKCSSCEAEYQIPASFAHDAARCKQCGGTVNIAPAGGPGTPEPKQAEAPRPKPQPKPAPKREPATPPRPAASRPAAGAEKKKRSTLERLKAERLAEREAAERGKAGQRQRTATPRPAQPKRPAVRAATRKGTAAAVAAAAASTRPRAGDDKAPKGAEKSSGSGRWHPPKKKKSPVGLIGIVVLLGLGGGAWFFRDTLFGSEEATASEKILEARLDETAPAPEDGLPEDGLSIEMPDEGADLDAAVETPAPDSGAPADVPDPASSQEPPAGTPEPASDKPDPFAGVEQPATRAPNPDSVDLQALGTFGPAIGCSEAEWDQMHEWLETWMDPDAGVKGNRAKSKLIGQSYEAIPVILNRMLTMDFSTSAGQDNGSQCQAALREICAGLNFNWKDGTEPGDVVFNKKVVKAWAKLWADASTDVEALIKILKLELEGTTPEGNGLRELYGVESIEIQTEADAGGEEDDFEID